MDIIYFVVARTNQGCEKNMPVRSIPECLQGCLEIDFAEQKVELVYHSKHLNDSAVADLQKYNPQWSFSLDDSLLTHHDRYIVIDNKMEIILSSGFMYLELTGKELTYVVRPVQENRLLVNG